MGCSVGSQLLPPPLASLITLGLPPLAWQLVLPQLLAGVFCKSMNFWINQNVKNVKISMKVVLQHFALCKAHIDFESKIKSPPCKHDFSSISQWNALKFEIPTNLKISEVPLYLFFHKILSKKFVSDRVHLNLQTKCRDNGGLLAFET